MAGRLVHGVSPLQSYWEAGGPLGLEYLGTVSKYWLLAARGSRSQPASYMPPPPVWMRGTSVPQSGDSQG